LFVITVLQAVIIGNVYILFIMRFPNAGSACEALLNKDGSSDFLVQQNRYKCL
jgi:hypothetical protein